MLVVSNKYLICFNVFFIFSVPGVRVRDVPKLVFGDSMIKNIRRLPNTQIICKRGVTLKTLSESMFSNHAQAIRQAEVVLVLAGTNDIESCSVSSLISVVNDIVTEYHRNFNGHIGFGTIIPRPKDDKFMAAKVKNFNKELMAWCYDNACVCIRMHSPFLKGGHPRRSLFNRSLLHLRVRGSFPSGVYILDNFLRSELSQKTLLPRIRKAESRQFGYGAL